MPGRPGKRAERDGFAEYAGGRWPLLVDDLVRRGADRDDAEGSLTSALGDVRDAWAESRDDTVLDDRVLAAALRAWRPGSGAEGDRVTLDLDHPPVLAPSALPLDQVEAHARRLARRRRVRGWRVAGGILAGVALLVGASWVVFRPEQPPPEVVAADNPAPVPWYSDGELHLSDVLVRLPDVRSIAEDDDDVVFEDADGFGTVAPDGSVERTDDRPEALDDTPAVERSGYRLVLPEEGLPGTVRVEDTAGLPISLGLADTDLVQAASLRTGGVVVLVVSHGPNAEAGGEFRRLSESGPLLMRLCDLQMRSCRELTSFPDHGTVLLPR